jgi:hypothetical protein
VPLLDNRAAMAAAVVAGAVALGGHGWPYGSGLLAAAVIGIAAGLAVSRATGSAEEFAEVEVA